MLIEHQSSINPNIALRLLMYIARVYEKIIDRKTIYGTQLQRLPQPEFFVLYNRLAEYPDEKIIRLSDAYESIISLGLPEKEKPSLELEVKVINIKHGRNEEKVKKCKTLAGYSAFVGKVQEFEKENLSREDAIKKAVIYCVEHNILKEFLEQNSSEVLNMLILDWNMEDALAVRFEEGIEKGMEKGITTTARNALAEGVAPEIVQKITGLDLETIKTMNSEL